MAQKLLHRSCHKPQNEPSYLLLTLLLLDYHWTSDGLARCYLPSGIFFFYLFTSIASSVEFGLRSLTYTIPHYSHTHPHSIQTLYCGKLEKQLPAFFSINSPGSQSTPTVWAYVRKSKSKCTQILKEPSSLARLLSHLYHSLISIATAFH